LALLIGNCCEANGKGWLAIHWRYLFIYFQL
jgi:hypothetical protein